MRRLAFVLLLSLVPLTIHAKDDPELNKALRLLFSGQKEQGISAIRTLAEAGNVEAELFLGRINARPNTLNEQPDPREALKWFTKASAEGSGEASAEIADLYDRGFGVVRSHSEVAKWLGLAAKQGWDQQELEVRCFTRIPSSEALVCQPWKAGTGCPTESEMEALQASGVTGRLRPTGGGGRSRLGPKARAIIILDHPIASEQRLKQPRHANVIYVQHGETWELLPKDAPLLDRPIVLSPQPDDHRYIMAGVQDVDGSVSAGGCASWPSLK